MMFSIRRIGQLAGLLILGACSAPAPKPPAQTAEPQQATPPAQAASPDGVYWGTSTRYVAERRDCPHPGVVTLAVHNGQFDYRWDWATDVLASISPDGTVEGASGNITLTGRLDGGELTGDISTASCALHFTTQRQT
jgi:hypothetical protein